MTAGNGDQISSSSSASGRAESATVKQRQQPGIAARFASAGTITFVTALCRTFLYGLNTTEVTGLDRFLRILDERQDPEKRQRGLITVSNHVSILDDPIMWGVLPLSYAMNPGNHRWGLGAHDICFKNKPLEWFFYTGQVLPTHRLHHSQAGGLFQPTMAQAIRLLSSQPFINNTQSLPSSFSSSSSSSPHYPPMSDPFTDAAGHMYSSNTLDSYPAPSSYLRNRFSWVHVFPEGMVHQSPQSTMTMRYFKWGVSRLILESEPMPDLLPIFIDGTQKVMPEDRTFPRFVPRAGVDFKVKFGHLVDMEERFGDLRSKWQELVQRQLHQQQQQKKKKGKSPLGQEDEDRVLVMGELTDELKYGHEAVQLRIEVARRVREEVSKVRRSMGYPDEPHGLELAETWARDGPMMQNKTKPAVRSHVDNSLEGKRR